MLAQWFSIWGDLVLTEHTASLEILLVVTVGVGGLMTSRGGGGPGVLLYVPQHPGQPPPHPKLELSNPRCPECRR